MASLEDQLRALRAHGVARAEFFENGQPKVIDFAPPSDQPTPSDQPGRAANAHAPKPPEIDLLTDVIMQPDRVPQLSEEDFPPDVIEGEFDEETEAEQPE
jgi:hypothetical protein